jgi:metallo-beta-lactamase family protein
LRKYAPDPRNTILFSGFQAAGTRGASMVAGAETIKMHGEYVPVRAEVENLTMLSAHADADGIMRWLRNFTQPPRMTFVTHGEPTAADTLRRRIKDELGWRAATPEQMECVKLT